MEEKTNNEKQDSIKVTRNSKGYTWEIKRYYDEYNDKAEDVIMSIKEIDAKLKVEFSKEKFDTEDKS